MIASYTIFDDAISKITYETVMIFSFSILSSIYFHVYLRFIVILYFLRLFTQYMAEETFKADGYCMMLYERKLMQEVQFIRLEKKGC